MNDQNQSKILPNMLRGKMPIRSCLEQRTYTQECLKHYNVGVSGTQAASICVFVLTFKHISFK